ncbi:MAG TPA: hypothetical protein DCQ26_07530 [Marinilabiliales bacterium]|nr:MAG: hypothetical protein A2W84_02820 [Bacteroidetes bacterium GWC2_40_13]OFX71884.1 MAG: hypothetical protein A2W96_06535 [Bacteroidetes bacterium GWD2_40_43]OFX94681.1 MAG: hypothetical protein A2W97_18340 [Bacteroidetes bacterium GWE2_40_63]OFY24790.1 MAG: hypothetical protein A2W88_16975 [Bacteroidetes bacterium GWF2_40_13]OFZ24447.1 MAG: hypothetical protein A2437_18475 [Bacteroidetes bacterium RIFOXYC2_FULL_40_12]HAM98448.1 hypothetical protein [Marinilabiliales bacterium]
MENELPNLLSSASILLAILTALFGFFYPSVKEVLEITPKLHSADNIKSYKSAKTIFKAKQIPLTIGSVIISLIFLPEMIHQIKKSTNAIITYGLKNVEYNTMIASYITVCLFMIFLTIMIIILGFRLRKQMVKLKP